MEMEVLFEINSSGQRKVLCLSRDELVVTVECEIGLLAGNEGMLAYFSCPRERRLGLRKRIYILQRWSKEWDIFLDVTDVNEVIDGDYLRLTIKLEDGSCSQEQQLRS